MTRRTDSAATRPATSPSATTERSGMPWSAEEDAVVEAALRAASRRRESVRWDRVSLPGRSARCVRARAAKLARALGIVLPSARWSRGELRTLRRVWTERTRRTILEHLPGRTWEGILAARTKLGLPSIPQGWVTLKSSSRALGMDPQTGRRIVAWAAAWAPLVESLCAWGHEVRRALGLTEESQRRALRGGRTEASGVNGAEAVIRWDGGAVETMRHTTTTTSASEARRWTLVEEGALEDAFERWRSWHDTPTAASRWDLRGGHMREIASAAGYSQPGASRALRLPASWWEDAAQRRGIARGGRSIAAHARRLGLSDDVLRRRLAACGIAGDGRSRRRYLSDAQVDAALAKRRAA